MPIYNVSITEALAGWSAGYWGQGVWGTSTQPTDTEVATLTVATVLTEAITNLDTQINNGTWVADLTETVNASESITTIYNGYMTVVETAPAIDTITNVVPWGVINDGQTPSWGAISTSQTPVWATISTAQTPTWTQITN